MSIRVRPLVALFALPALALAAVAPFNTGFDPSRHGFNFVNYGDFGSPGGNCWSMSLLAIHEFMKSRGQAIAPHLGTARPENADALKQIVTSLVQAELRLSSGAGGSGENPRKPLTDVAPMKAALQRIKSGGVPEVLIYVNDTVGHANVLYGYDGKNLLLYDPNDPLQVMKWPWDETKGFGDHPKKSQGSLFADSKWYSSTPFSRFKVSSRLEAMRQACANRENVCVGRFPGIDARVDREAGGDLVLLGRLGKNSVPHTGGDRPPAMIGGSVWVSMGGSYVVDGQIRKPRGNTGAVGVFGVKLPKNLPEQGTLRAVILTASGTFAGYIDVPLGGRAGAGPNGSSSSNSTGGVPMPPARPAAN